FSSACGKLVRSQATAKLSQLIGQGSSKPVPDASCAGVFSATATARYSGMMTVRAHTAMSAVAHQLVRRVSDGSPPERRRRRGTTTAVVAGPASTGVVTEL